VATAPIVLTATPMAPTPTPMTSKPTSDPPTALTLATAVSAMEFDCTAGHPPVPTFRDMPKDDKDDDESKVELAWIVKQEPENSDMDINELAGDSTPRMNGGGKGRQGLKVEDSESDYDLYMRSPIIIKPRHVRQSMAATGQSKYGPRSRPTGDYFDPPCSTCHVAGRACEQDMRGGSCSQCKVSKRACEYAKPRTSRRVKSKPTVDSKDDEKKYGSESGAEHQSAPRLNPRTRSPARRASKRAMQAIHSEIVIPVENKPPTPRRAAVKKSKGKSIRICISYHVSLTSVAVRQSSPSQLVEDPSDLVTAWLQRLTENAELALVPRESQLERNI
jgi:hypothetical protein